MRYISQLIGETYKEWGARKVILTAPTGAGKTTFVVRILLLYHFLRGCKVLILCNRRLLRMQYWAQVIRLFRSYGDLTQAVEIKTYQQIAEELRSGVEPQGMFSEYACIVCDEVHYFISDADFNGFGTFVVLQAILYAGLEKQMLFMSATMEQVKDELYKTLERCVRYYQFKNGDKEIKDECRMWIPYDYSYLEDYGRFQCFAVPDVQTLMERLIISDGKAVIFYDDRTEGEKLQSYAVDKYGLPSNQIVTLNADSMENAKKRNFVERLALCNRFDEKILVTTSVLDNGVSIHDDEVENIAIITDSKVSFQQMLGRIRCGKRQSVNLYFVLKPADVFRSRQIKLELLLNLYGKAASSSRLNAFSILHQMIPGGRNDEAEDLRKVYIISKENLDFYSFGQQKVVVSYGNARIVINEFGKIKTGDLYLIENLLYQLALDNPIKVVEEQMGWIGKEPDELKVEGSKYFEDMKAELKKKLLTVQRYDKEQLQEVKKFICQNYGKNILKDVLMKSGTISNEKLRGIVERLGLIYDDSELVDGKKVYTIKMEESEDA